MARIDITMTPAEVQAFLEEPRSIQVATVGPDGFPHVAPMWYLVQDGKVGFRSFTKSQKIVNLRRDPRVTLLAEEGDSYAELRGLMIKGRATLTVDRDLVLDWYRQLARRNAFFGGRPNTGHRRRGHRSQLRSFRREEHCRPRGPSESYLMGPHETRR